MRISRPVRRHWAAAFLALAIPFASAGEEAKPPEWWAVQQEVTALLLERGESIAALAARVRAAPPETARDAMFRVCVLLRAGMNDDVAGALRELKRLAPDLENHQVSGIYYYACDRLQAWDVARALAETFADNVSDLTLSNRLLKHWLETGWTVDEVDRWLAGMPAGKEGFWVKERLRFNVAPGPGKEHFRFNVAPGRGEAAIRRLADGVRENTADIEGLLNFLGALAYAGVKDGEGCDLSWVPEKFQPGRATDAEKIASGLRTVHAWAASVPFYRRAIEIPLKDEECKELGRMYAAFVPIERIRAMFAVHTREELAECLLKTGDKNEAQRWMVEAADLRKEYGLGSNAMFAGQVQAQSGQRVVEGRIRDEEKRSENDPQYWQDRAAYYRGRKETAQEEEALLKGLTLTAPAADPANGRAADSFARRRLLGDYALFLKRTERPGEAVALLREEIRRAAPDSEMAVAAAQQLAFEFEQHIDAGDEVLWTWLDRRPRWEYTEQRLLWRVLERANPGDRDTVFARAEKATVENDPSRAAALGWILNRMGFPQRSVPLLLRAVEAARDEKLRDEARFTLMESYLDVGDWRKAEELFPLAAKRLTPEEVPEWYGRVALAAARAGAKPDAVRIWRRVSNLGPPPMRLMEDLVAAGLGDELKEFYRRMRSEMPGSETAAAALDVLEK